MRFAKFAVIAAVLFATAASAAGNATPGEFPWQIGGGIHLPPQR